MCEWFSWIFLKMFEYRIFFGSDWKSLYYVRESWHPFSSLRTKSLFFARELRLDRHFDTFYALICIRWKFFQTFRNLQCHSDELLWYVCFICFKIFCIVILINVIQSYFENFLIYINRVLKNELFTLIADHFFYIKSHLLNYYSFLIIWDLIVFLYIFYYYFEVR